MASEYKCSGLLVGPVGKPLQWSVATTWDQKKFRPNMVQSDNSCNAGRERCIFGLAKFASSGNFTQNYAPLCNRSMIFVINGSKTTYFFHNPRLFLRADRSRSRNIFAYFVFGGTVSTRA